jgi:hypothetical protein
MEDKEYKNFLKKLEHENFKSQKVNSLNLLSTINIFFLKK